MMYQLHCINLPSTYIRLTILGWEQDDTYSVRPCIFRYILLQNFTLVYLLITIIDL
jgi:hypothetical protein